MAKKADKKVEAQAPALQFEYLCPACSGIAIETSNKMLDVEIDCRNCGKRIKLDDPERYKKIK